MSDFSAFVAAVRAGDPDECNATVRAAFRETAELPAEEIAARTAELAELIGSDPVPVDCAAYPALVGGALVESGHGAGPAGPAALRRLAGAAPDLRSFLRALPGPDGAGGAPEPGRVDDGQAARITRELGDGGAAVRTWRALDLLGRAVLTFLNVEEVRDGLRADPEVSAVLRALCTELDEAVGGYRPALLLLDLNEVDTLLVLDRESGRGFRIRPTGVTDTDQLHALLAGALIGPQGRGLPGTPPAPEVVAVFRDQDPPEGEEVPVRGAWTLHDADGYWLTGSRHPASVPDLDGERVVVLDPVTMQTQWYAGRAFPMVRAGLEVLAELPADEARSWLDRVTPARVI